MDRALTIGFVLAATAVPATAEAHFGFAQTVEIRTHPTDPSFILAGTTFGPVSSTDGGATFTWVCEGAVGYDGQYLPDYEIGYDGRIYATSWTGLRVSDDGGCSYSWVTDGITDLDQVGDIEVGPDGRVWISTFGASNQVRVSDDGSTFAPAGVSHPTAGFRDVRVAPSDAARIYTSAFVFSSEPGAHRAIYRSDDGGESWTELSVTDFAFGAVPQVYIIGVSPTDPDVVFAKVAALDAFNREAIYRSADGGESWTEVLSMAGLIGGFVVRSDGMGVIAGTRAPCDPEQRGDLEASGCVRVSTDGGLTWAAAGEEPELGCVAETADGVLIGCGNDNSPDFFALGRSTDAASWEPILRFSTVEPAACVTQDSCPLEDWKELCSLLGICDTVSEGATTAGAGGGGAGGAGGGPVDAPSPPPSGANEASSGCSVEQAGSRPGWMVAVWALLGGAGLRRRRRHRR